MTSIVWTFRDNKFTIVTSSYSVNFSVISSQMLLICYSDCFLSILNMDWKKLNKKKPLQHKGSRCWCMVEPRGIEPLTSSLPAMRSPSWAKAPFSQDIHDNTTIFLDMSITFCIYFLCLPRLLREFVVTFSINCSSRLYRSAVPTLQAGCWSTL